MELSVKEQDYHNNSIINFYNDWLSLYKQKDVNLNKLNSIFDISNIRKSWDLIPVGTNKCIPVEINGKSGYFMSVNKENDICPFTTDKIKVQFNNTDNNITDDITLTLNLDFICI